MQAFGWLTRDAVDPNMASGERTVSEDGGEDAIGWSEAAVRTNGLDDTAGVEVIEQGLMRLDVPHLPVESLDLDRLRRGERAREGARGEGIPSQGRPGAGALGALR